MLRPVRPRPRADHVVRFLLDQAVQSRCPLAQLVVVAAERPPDVYLSWIARGRGAASVPVGRLGIVDCFSDPCGWKAAWRAQPDHNAAASRGGGGGQLSSTSFGKVRMTSATRKASDGFQELVSAVQGLLAPTGGSDAAGHAGIESEGCVVSIPRSSFVPVAMTLPGCFGLLQTTTEAGVNRLGELFAGEQWRAGILSTKACAHAKKLTVPCAGAGSR